MTIGVATETPILRSVDHMLLSLESLNAESSGDVPEREGRRRAIEPGVAFRHDYDPAFAEGGWEFYRLESGVYLTIVDMVACRVLLRRHSAVDHLVLSAVIDGDVTMNDDDGSAGELASGYCTLYGMDAGSAALATVCEPGRAFRWVSVFIERSAFYRAMSLMPEDVPADCCSFLSGEQPLPCRNVPLSRAASLTVMQILECRYEHRFRLAFLRAKAVELACHILSTLRSHVDDELERTVFSQEEHRKLQRALRYLRHDFEEPPSVAELAYAVGMSRQRLQQGFRLVFGDTVVRLRDKFRMEHALELVRNSSKSMIDIALQTGYEHNASFTRAFKSAFGASPSHMRKLSQEQLARPRAGVEAG